MRWFGRSARQGNAGSAETVTAVGDELFLRFAWPLNGLAQRVTGQHQRLPAWLVRAMVRLAQLRAERYNRSTRLNTMKQDRKTQDMMGFAGRNT